MDAPELTVSLGACAPPAAAAAKGNRQEILLAGQHLAKLISVFCDELKDVAARTKDARLANKLTTLLTSLRNMSTQTKILCSVKAASTKDAPDTDEQLISLTRNLTKDIGSSLDTVAVVKKTGRLQP